MLELTAEGAERLAAGTRAALKRRIAVVVDGKVVSAPAVQTEIAGGRLTVTLGAADLDQGLAEAERLAVALRRARTE